MPYNVHNLSVDLTSGDTATSNTATPETARTALEWDWDVDYEDRKLEEKADAAFQIDRKVLKDVVKEKMGIEVGRINFLSSGTFHKAYLITLKDQTTLVARVARRFMPRLKTESEVATIKYLCEHTSIPVPTIYHHDSNPYNRLGGEYILMSKAPGIPLAKVYHSMAHDELVKLLENLAHLIISLFSHRFSQIGSLYSGPNQPPPSMPSSISTPKPSQFHGTGFPFSSVLSMSSIAPPMTPKHVPQEAFHVGPIISWPFFGSNRGELSHPDEMDRGPWSTTESYLISCAQREIDGVIRENEGQSAPHRLHLDPDEIQSSRHHHLKAVPGDESDDSDEWDLQESEEEWEGPGDAMYRDYRRMQRSTFLVAHMAKRVESVRQEMQRWVRVMERLGVGAGGGGEVGGEEFGLDCHDLSLENIFVDEDDHSTIACIIDWESTTIRPLWACAHLPIFLQSSPFIADLFRDVVLRIATSDQITHSTHNCRPDQGKGSERGVRNNDLARLAHLWLRYESKGTRLRMAHRCVEWDGWEEGLVESILGPEEQEEEWYRDLEASPGASESTSDSDGCGIPASLARLKQPFPRLPSAGDKEKVQMLDTTGDICGGRGGELGRRLEAWLHVNEGDIVCGRRWSGEQDVNYKAEEE